MFRSIDNECFDLASISFSIVDIAIDSFYHPSIEKPTANASLCIVITDIHTCLVHTPFVSYEFD